MVGLLRDPAMDAPDLDTPWGITAHAEALLDQGCPAEAEQLLRQGMARFPDNPWPGSVLAGLLNRQERWRDAEGEWTRLVARFPDHAPAYGGLAGALAATGDLQGAYEAVSRGVERCPDVYWLRVQHADAAADAGEDPRQVAALWKAVAAAWPDEAYPRVQRARALLRAGDARRAWSDLQSPLQRSPDDETLLILALDTLLDLDAVDEALPYWRRLRGLGQLGPGVLDIAWRLFAALEARLARRELLAALLSEPPSGTADWRPVIVMRIQSLGAGPVARAARDDIRNFLEETVSPGERTLLHRLVWA